MKIQAKVAVTTFIAAIIPLVATLFLALWYSSVQLSELALTNAARSVEAGAQQLSGYFAARAEAIAAYGRMPLLRRLDWGQIRPYFESELASPSGRFDKLFIGLPDATFYATSAAGNPAYGGRVSFDDDDPNAPLQTLADRRYWRYTVGDNPGAEPRTLMSRPLYSYTTGDRQVNVVSTLLSPDGTLLGLVGGSLEWRRIKTQLDALRAVLVGQFGEGAELVLLADDGSYIYPAAPGERHRDRRTDGGPRPVRPRNIADDSGAVLAPLWRRMHAGASGAQVLRDGQDDAEVLVAYAPVAAANYRLAAILPKAELLKPLERLRLGLGWTLAAAMPLVLLVSMMLAGRLVRPVRTLSAAAARFADGRRDLDLEYRGRDELADLTRNFRQLVAAVTEREQLDAWRQQQLSLLSKAAGEVNASLQVDAVLHALITYALKLVGAESGIVGRVEGARMQVRDYCRNGVIETVECSFEAGEGVVGRALSQPQPYRCDDAASDPCVDPTLRHRWGIRDLCMVPIVDSDGEVQGCFEVYNKRGGGHFDDQDLEMLQALAATAATAFLNARAVEQRERALEDLRRSKARLRNLAEKASLETGTAYFRSLVGHLCSELEVEYAFVGLLDAERARVRTIAVQQRGRAVDNFDYPLAGTPCQQLLASDAWTLTAGVRERYPEDGRLGPLKAEGYAAVALKDDEGAVVGLIGVIDREPLADAQEQLSLLQLFAIRARAELQRQRAEEALRLAATAFETHEAIIICDARGRIQRVNQAFTNITGYPEAEVLGRNPNLLSSGVQDRAFYRQMWASLNERGFWQGELWNRRKDGSRYAEWLSINRVCDEAGTTTHYVGAFLDLTKQKQQQAFIERSMMEEEVLSALLRLSHRGNALEAFLEDGLRLLIESPVWHRRMLRASAFTCDGDGEGEMALVAQSHPQGEGCERCAGRTLHHCFGDRVARQERRWREADADPITFVPPDGDGSGCYLVLIRDKVLLGVLVCCVPEAYRPTVADENFLMRLADVLGMGVSRRQAEARIEFQAYHDELTGLPNRRLLMDRLNQELTVARRRELNGALLFIDLDQFKRLNDALGHSIGDLLLQQVAERLQELLRAQDSVARLGGDEFVIILPALDGGEEEAASHAYLVADKIRWGLSQLYRLGDHEFQLTPSIGIVLFPAEEESAEDLLKHADTAMYQAKKEGRNTARFYRPSMQEQADTRLAIEKELRQALEAQQLELYFQPQVRADGEVVGAEVLVRWRHPERGMVSPALFIPVAEDAGLILEIGTWVLHAACRQIHRWELAGSRHCHLAVNVSPKQFRQPNFVETVEQCLQDTGIDPRHLELEVTEGMLIRDIENTIDKMAHIRALGVRFSIDDFGTGYSSLAYLKRLPLDILKIDRSFVEGVHQDAHDAAICATIIAMARHLKLAVIAEGVETEEERQFLFRHGCEIYQGFHFSRPLPLEAFEAFLSHRDATVR